MRAALLILLLVSAFDVCAQEAEKRVHAVSALITKGSVVECSLDPTHPDFVFCSPSKPESYAHLYVSCSAGNETHMGNVCRTYPFPPTCVMGIGDAIKTVKSNGCEVSMLYVNGRYVGLPIDDDALLKACSCPPA